MRLWDLEYNIIYNSFKNGKRSVETKCIAALQKHID